jgi:hypothetical protein
MHTRFATLAIVAALAIVPAWAQVRLTKQDADRFESKLGKIVLQGKSTALKSTQARSAATTDRSTPLTDLELNSYLAFNAKDQVPTGILEPTLNALGDGRVSGRAIVDLDVVRTQKQRGFLDPVGYLSGRLPVTASGRLTTKDGQGQFQLESAAISGVSVPKAVLQELLTYYSKSPENPNGISMEAPFELPAGIREIRVGAGTSTVVQ